MFSLFGKSVKSRKKRVLEQHLDISSLVNSCLVVVYMSPFNTFLFSLLKMEIRDPVLPVFGLLLYRFSVDNFPKCGQLNLEFVPVMQCNVLHQIFDSFCFIEENWSKLAKNPSFWVIFRGFLLTPSYAHRFTPQFLCQIKGLMEIHNRGKFHLCRICGSQVIKFQIVSWRCSIHEMAHFGGFLSPFSPK